MIIGLIGFKQTGKSTAAAYLEKKYGFVRHNMKDALVAEMKKNFRNTLLTIGKLDPEKHSDDEIINSLFETKPPVMRALMQNYGTEVRRGDDPNYWVNQWVNNLPEGNVVVDDIRFTQEFDAVKKRGALTIRIVKSDVTTGGSHISETEHLQFLVDFTIEAEHGNFQKLYEQLDKIML